MLFPVTLVVLITVELTVYIFLKLPACFMVEALTIIIIIFNNNPLFTLECLKALLTLLPLYYPIITLLLPLRNVSIEGSFS